MLKKYITYAKLNCFPKLQDADLDKLTHVYAELRRESSVSELVVSLMSFKSTFFAFDLIGFFLMLTFGAAWSRSSHSSSPYREHDPYVRSSCENTFKTSCFTGRC